MNEITEYVTVTQAAKILGLARTSVPYHIKMGNLPVTRFGAKLLAIRRSDLERFQAGRR
jgi:excisionase family DNA binding protein